MRDGQANHSNLCLGSAKISAGPTQLADDEPPGCGFLLSQLRCLTNIIDESDRKLIKLKKKSLADQSWQTPVQMQLKKKSKPILNT